MAGTLLRQTFAKDLVKNLWPANDFISFAKDDTPFVNDDVVNLPHAGTLPSVVTDRTAKGTATKRTDSATKYSLHEASTDPTWLQYSEELLAAYDKRASILEQHKNALITNIADNTAYYWGLGGDDTLAVKPAVLRTSGATRASSAPGATGVRKGMNFADVIAVVNALNKQDVPNDGGRIALINADFFADIIQLAEFKSADYNRLMPVEGAPLTFSWMGFKWFVRSRVNNFDTAAAIKAVGAAGVATDNAGSMFWHKDFVRRAKGDVKVFLNLDDAELYGSKMSCAARYGAFGARKDGYGIINLVEIP